MSVAVTPLGPYRVLDLTNQFGFFCGRILAALGADVIKIEPPGGDAARHNGPYVAGSEDPERSLTWFAYNLDKRAVTLDLENPEGREIFERLVTTADFVLETFAVGHFDRLGLGYDALARLNPGLIMAAITPFGQTGPRKDYQATDLVSSATGSMLGAGYPDRAPLRFSVEQSFPQAGAQAAVACLIAFHHRALTGQGQFIDFSVQECQTQTVMSLAQTADLLGVDRSRDGIRQPRGHLSTRSIFECRDGHLCWNLYVAALGAKTNALRDLMRDWGESHPVLEMDFTQIDMNAVHQPDLESWEVVFEEFFLKHTKAELHREAVARDIMLFPVSNTADLLADPQLQARGFWVDVAHPELDRVITYPGAPYQSSETPWQTKRRAPLVGEHNREVYADLGISEARLAELAAWGVI